MTVYLSGTEWERFLQDGTVWTKGARYADETMRVDGRLVMDDFDDNTGAHVEITGGVFVKSDRFPPQCFETLLADWLKRHEKENLG